ncbi:hypothetical protein TNIN_455061 [Trichonephila inaurata madagascariensis]|uniref:Uncharacterized protein n=1 Tax=Trichonephila inaurata madagascariensis TaxID=2747483 RepID=A0A8X6YSS6_9ARAC|nr:hypothetical protein TNIN_455061 [Trichonephila inaurata madagascariensis]
MGFRKIAGVLLLWTLIHCVQGLVIRTDKNPCTHLFFKCDSKCIGRTQYCDDVIDCYDSTDELYCVISHRDSCPHEWLRCADNARCYPSNWLCDGVNDCLDNSDESNCDGVPCSPDVFRCSNGKCIERSGFCNGSDDCRDYTDEFLCSITTLVVCSSGWSRCADDTRCFPSHWRCDGTKDCLDGSDEETCGEEIRNNTFSNNTCSFC